MTTNNHAIDIDAAQQNGPDRQYDALSDDFAEGAGNGQPIGLAGEDALPGEETGLPIRNPDVAIYHAKNRAGNSYYLFTPAMNSGAIICCQPGLSAVQCDGPAFGSAYS